jgi:hypothetical protein
MFHRSIHNPQRRKATILMVVIVLLMLFLVIGIAFVLYAESQATAARIYREASISREYPTAEQLLGWSLGEIIYDAPDDPTGQNSAIRGHGLARNMYGWNYNGVPLQSSTYAGVSNTTPYNGSGRLHTTSQNPWGQDDAKLINYQYWQADGFPGQPGTGRIPERLFLQNQYQFTGGANPSYTYPDLNSVFLAWAVYNPQSQSYDVQLPSYWRGQFTGFNPPNRSDVFRNNPNWTALGAAAAPLKYMTLRPRPADQLLPTEPQSPAYLQQLLANNQVFPLPATDQGDVRNLPGTGPNDSIWMDLGYPIVTLSTGRQVKPMFAILILDLDGKVNYNVAGNIKEGQVPNNTNGSNQGWGPWEINPRQLMGSASGGAQYTNLFWGDGKGASGRYGSTIGSNPSYPTLPAGYSTPFNTPGLVQYLPQVKSTLKGYGGADWDASSVTNGAGQLQLPPQSSQFSALPNFKSRFQASSTNATEEQNHPNLFNPFRINLPGTNLTNHLFPISDLAHLLNPDATYPPFPSGDVARSEIGNLWALNFGAFPNMRTQLTPLSSDMHRMAAAPGLAAYGQGGAQGPGIFNLPLAANGSPPNSLAFPYASQAPGTGASVPFALGPLLPQRPNGVSGNLGSLTGPGSDMRPNDWRSALADMGLVDLNRPLTPFPDRSGNQPQGGNPYNAAEQQQAQQAMAERQNLAYDIFSRFCMAVGLPDPNDMVNMPRPTLQPPANDTSNGGPIYEGYRYLAQLAVNIVDYIDEDDVMTVFLWMKRNDLGNNVARNRFVFGTEMPRLVINEVYAQIQNDPTDTANMPPYTPGNTGDPDTISTEQQPGTAANPTDRAFTGLLLPPPPNPGHKAYFANKAYRVNFFVSLNNPQNQDNNLTEAGNARLQFNNAWSPYQVWIRSQVDDAAGLQPAQRNMTAPWNVTGVPQSQGAQPPRIDLKVMNFGQKFTVSPSNQNANNGFGDGTPNNSAGFCLLAPGDGSGANDWQSQVPFDRVNAGNSPAANQGLTIINPQNIPFPPGSSVAEWGNPPPAPKMSSQLYDTVPVGSLSDVGLMAIGTNTTYQPSVFLRRLANPYLAPNETPGSPAYNPYITVDYLEHVHIQDAVLFGGPGPQDHRRDGVVHNGRPASQRQPLGPNPGAFGAPRVSYGRRQPFSASGMAATQTPQPNENSTIQNTFFMLHGMGAGNPGATLDQPFQWYTHLDRQVVNPIELMEVSGYKPHLLTQTFVARTPAGLVPYAHRPPWYNVNVGGGGQGYVNPIYALIPGQNPFTGMSPADTRLYRLLGVLGTRDRTEGMAFGGRLQGRMNINMMADDIPGQAQRVSSVFRALADPQIGQQQGDYFSQAQVDTVWNAFSQQRTPNIVPGPTDKPAYSLITTTLPGDTQYAPQSSFGATVLRNNPATPGTEMIDSPPQGTQPHPYVQHEMLRKIYTNMTTRSNTFAVFITTGFFDVRSQQPGRPPLLGGEVNPELRHRFFAVVDRTNLSSQDIAQLFHNGPSAQFNPRMQANRPIYISFEPTGVVPAQPPGAVQPPNVAPAGSTQIQISVLATGDPVNNKITLLDQTGASAEAFDIIQNPNMNPPQFNALPPVGLRTILYVDVGNAQERMVVTGITPAPAANTVQYNLVLMPLGPTSPYNPGPSQFTHYRGAALSTQIAGNPGPQNYPIAYWQAPYSNTVIGYQQILK